MNIAFMGAQGTGKTTTLQEVSRKISTSYHIIGDQYRILAQALDYTNPRQIILESGTSHYSQSMSAFVAAALGSFSQLTSSQACYNFTDLDPITYYAYYLYWINKDAKKHNIAPKHLPFIKKLVQYYTTQLDIHFYFPSGAIPLKSDDMRAFDPEFQLDIENHIQESINNFNIKKLKYIESISVEDRADEVLYWINKMV